MKVTQSGKSPETWEWLQEHWEDILAPVPHGTRWTVLSHDGHTLPGYGDDVDLLREQAVANGESEPMTVAVPDMSPGYHI